MTLLGLFLLLAYDGIAQTGKKGGGDKASDGQITNWGQPKAFAGAKTNINAHWIWYDDGVWHFRTTGDGKGARQFQGKTEVVGGELVSLTGKKGEYKASWATGRSSPRKPSPLISKPTKVWTA